MSTNLTESTFNSTLSEAEGVSVVQFTASWCGPCKMLAPRLQELEDQGQVNYFKVDVDTEGGLAASFRIMSVPTVLVYEGGEEINSWVGVKTDKEILDKLKPVS